MYIYMYTNHKRHVHVVGKVVLLAAAVSKAVDVFCLGKFVVNETAVCLVLLYTSIFMDV